MELSRPISLFLLGCLVALTATATSLDRRGWSTGKPAAAMDSVLGMPAEPIALNLPSTLLIQPNLPTLLVYFSPGCPHCQAVAPELSTLEQEIEGKAEIILVASGGTTTAELAEFRAHYDFTSRSLIDEDRLIGAAMGIRSTPSALLVRKTDTQVLVETVWYPYFSGYDTLLKMRLHPSDPWVAFEPNKYQGSRTCGACHQHEIEAWSLSHHSIAWKTLEDHHATQREECIGYHVTGYNQAKGWEPKQRPHLVDVGCESCHGPGGPHDGERDNANQSCEPCHDAKHSIAFSLEKGLPLIDHYTTVTMSDHDYVERRKALHRGEAPKGLLAFQEGKMVGSKTCKTCHTKSYKHWQHSPHAKAMGTLTRPYEAECVQCHATAKQSGPPPTDLAGYLVEEGVGCESCHGPGDAHVKAGGGTENIEKLGDDCPVCVIEAVCTRCHTPKWDPQWNLEADLPKASHSH